MLFMVENVTHDIQLINHEIEHEMYFLSTYFKEAKSNLVSLDCFGVMSKFPYANRGFEYSVHKIIYNICESTRDAAG